MGKRWTTREVALLHGSMEDHSIEWIAGQIGRAPSAVWQKASKLGLLAACRQGQETTVSAARRCGVAPSTMRRVIAWAGLQARRGKSPLPEPARRAGVLRYFDPDDVDRAMARWLATETLKSACRRHRIDPATMRGYLRALGASTSTTYGRLVRLDSDVYDRAVAAGRARRTAALATGESIRGAARRVGVGHDTLARLLRDAGLDPRRGVRTAVDPAAVDRVVAAYRARPRVRPDRAGRETLAGAAARLRVARRTLARELRAAGVAVARRGSPASLAPDAVDRVVATYRARRHAELSAATRAMHACRRDADRNRKAA